MGLESIGTEAISAIIGGLGLYSVLGILRHTKKSVSSRGKNAVEILEIVLQRVQEQAEIDYKRYREESQGLLNEIQGLRKEIELLQARIQDLEAQLHTSAHSRGV